MKKSNKCRMKNAPPVNDWRGASALVHAGSTLPAERDSRDTFPPIQMIGAGEPLLLLYATER
jgi:hypothetical protein